MGGQALKNLAMFQKLCGKQSLSHVVLATTMWDKLEDPVEGERREDELINHEDWWGDMRDLGSEVRRHDGTLDSALCIIDYIMNLEGNGTVTALAEDIIDKKLPLESTAVGKEVRKDLLEADARHADEVKQVKESMEAMIAAGNQKAAAKLEAMKKEMEEAKVQRDKDMEDLKQKYSDIEQQNKEEHDKLVDTLEAEVKLFKEQAKTSKKNHDRLETSLKNDQTNYDNLQQELVDNKLQHKRDLAEMDKKWDKEWEQWEAQRREEQRRRDEARKEAENGGLGSVIASYVTGTVLGCIGIATFQPGIAALGAASFAKGAATAASSLR